MSDDLASTRPHSVVDAILGLTPPTEQRSWKDDDKWLEFGSCHAFCDDHNFRVHAGSEPSDEEDEPGFPTVLVSIYDLRDGDHLVTDMTPGAARHLADLLIAAADEAEELAEDGDTHVDPKSLMEKERAEFHEEEARQYAAIRKAQEKQG